jgi:hypothetical protein
MHRPISLWPQIRRMKCRSPAVAITSLRPCSLGVNRPNGLSTCAAGTIVLDRCAALQLVRLRCAAWGYGAWRYAQGRGSFGTERRDFHHPQRSVLRLDLRPDRRRLALLLAQLVSARPSERCGLSWLY